MSEVRNLLDSLPTELADERIETLLEREGVRVERILSCHHASPPGFWYDQPDDEWVLLISGAATLLLTVPDERLELAPGDSLLIPAHRRHRVEATAADGIMVWLAVHCASPHAEA